MPAAYGGFASCTEPGFVFCLLRLMRVGVCTARAPLMPPEAIIQTRCQGLAEILRDSSSKQTGSKDFGSCKGCHWPPNPGAGQRQLRRRWTSLLRVSPKSLGGVHWPNAPQDRRGRSQVSPPHWDGILPRADGPAGQHFLRSHPFSHQVTEVGIFLFLI